MEVEVSSDVVDDGVKCEELEKVIIESDVEKYFQGGSNCLFEKRRSYWLSLERMWMYLLGVPMKLQGRIPISFVII